MEVFALFINPDRGSVKPISAAILSFLSRFTRDPIESGTCRFKFNTR